jgi:hypothetical protein
MRFSLECRLWVILLACMAGGCEASPRIATTIVVPQGLSVSVEQLHLEVASGSDPAFVPKYHDQPVENFKQTSDGIEIVFLPRFGRETYTYARVWIDVDRNGVPSKGDLAGELSPAPFRAESSRLNQAPQIFTKSK